LAAITSAVSVVRQAGPLNPAQQCATAELEEAAARLNRLVQNLLDLSRLQAGQLRTKTDWQDTRDLIHAGLQNVGRALAGRPVKIEVAPDLPPLKFDFALTEQVLVNLLANVAAHTPAGTPVEIHARAESGELVLEIADRGPGLPSGLPERLFERFQRGANAAPGGTGLGLSLVKGFTEAQGGTVAAANRPGGGAVFTVRLPLSKMPHVLEDKA